MMIALVLHSRWLEARRFERYVDEVREVLSVASAIAHAPGQTMDTAPEMNDAQVTDFWKR